MPASFEALRRLSPAIIPDTEPLPEGSGAFHRGGGGRYLAVIGHLLLIPGASRAMADKRPEEWGFLSGDYLRDRAQAERSPHRLLPAGYNVGRFLAVMADDRFR